jgi:adenylate cyclase
LLLTDKVAELVAEPTEELGNFPIRGIAHPVALSAVAERRI